MGQKTFGVAVIGLVAVISALVVLVIQSATGTKAVAETGMSAHNMLAVTGRVGTDNSVLYVIDTDKKQMAVYSAFGGRKLRFLGARKILFDFELVEYNDATPREMSVPRLAKLYRESKLKGDEKEDDRRPK